MSEYLKPQKPLYIEGEDRYVYPLTTEDQVVLTDGTRLNVKLDKVDEEMKTVKEATGNIKNPTLTDHLASEAIILKEGLHYGDTLPDPDVPGRLFFKRVTD